VAAGHPHPFASGNTVFPQLSMTTYNVNIAVPMSSENSQKLISYFTDGAKLNHDGVCLYTTHTF
jgi:hypothetical protein